MDVPSYGFIAFAAVAALLCNISANARWRMCFFAVANLAFLAFFMHDVHFWLPFAVFVLAGYVAYVAAERTKSVKVLYIAVPAAVLALCILKKYTFIPQQLLLHYPYFVLGVSYVFFRIVHVIIEAAQDTLGAKLSFVEYIAYTLNFATITAGPIQLYQDYAETASRNPLPLNAASLGYGLERLIIGLLKVSVVSPLILHVQAQSASVLHASQSVLLTIAMLALTIFLYAVHLYCNFSGYTDFVIGVARFFRLRLPENFAHPFMALSYIDYWSRWHITLSHWLKTYVYTPLLLASIRRFPAASVSAYLGVIAYFVTFFLVGVWHGSTAQFAVFGVLEGLGVSVNKLYQILLIKRIGKKAHRALNGNVFYAALSRGLTVTWFSFSLLWFYLSGEELHQWMAAFGAGKIAAGVLLLWPCVALLLFCVKYIGDAACAPGRPVVASTGLRVCAVTLAAVLTVSTAVIFNAPAPAIVYRAF